MPLRNYPPLFDEDALTDLIQFLAHGETDAEFLVTISSSEPENPFPGMIWIDTSP